MQKILIPVSNEISKDKILKHIQLIGNSNTYKVILFRSVPMPESVGYMQTGSDDPSAEIAKEREIHLVELGEYEKELRKNGYLTEVFVMVGQFEKDLVEFIQQIKPDLLLMPTQGAQNIFEEIFGTNTSSIIEKIQVPVFVIKFDREQKELKKSVVGLPLDIENLDAIQDYFDFENKMNLESHFVKIDENFELSYIDDEDLLNRLNELYPGKIDLVVHRESEDIADGVEKYANETNADVIVLFTTKKNFIEKLFHHSVTQSLIKHSKVPLLIYHY